MSREAMMITIDEYPEMTTQQIDQEIAFLTAEMIAYGNQIMYPNENKQIIKDAVENCKSKIEKYNRLKKLRS